MTATLTKTETLYGQELLDFVHSNLNLTNSQLCERTGHMNQNFFNDAIMAARLFKGEYPDALYSVDLLERIQQVCDVNQAECVEIARQLHDDYNVTDESDFDDIFAGVDTGWNCESDFAQYWTVDIMNQEIPDFVVVDWQATWDCNLRHDFFTLEYSEGMLFFHNH